jgi:hypothetical protein
MLRVIVFAGLFLGIILSFIPQNTDGMSQLQVTRYHLSHGDGALGLWHFATFLARVAFLILVLVYPRRWVFICGAAWASCVLLYNLVVGVPWNGYQLLNTIQLLMRVVGFCVFFSPQRDARSH